MNPLTSAMDAINARPLADESQALVAAKCRGLMAGYHARWGNVAYDVYAVEQFVNADLWNPETNKKSRTFRIAGKLDVQARYGGRNTILDHKTTSAAIADADEPYWRQLVIEGQITHYMLLEWLNGRKVEDATWDVIRKPSISPKSLSKKDIEMVVMSQSYLGYSIPDEAIEEMKATGRETLEMYEARLMNDCINERPNWYFQRRTIPRMDSEVAEYAQELWNHGQEILHARNTGRNDRNSGACMMYGSPCKFLGICSGHDSPDSANWTRKDQVHVELPIVGSDGRDILTNSRIRCFQTCRRKAYYEYELGIERVNEEEKEALYFGTLIHSALEAYFTTYLPKDERLAS